MKYKEVCKEDCYNCSMSSFRVALDKYPFAITCNEYNRSFPLWYRNKDKVFSIDEGDSDGNMCY